MQVIKVLGQEMIPIIISNGVSNLLFNKSSLSLGFSITEILLIIFLSLVPAWKNSEFRFPIWSHWILLHRLQKLIFHISIYASSSFRVRWSLESSTRSITTKFFLQFFLRIQNLILIIGIMSIGPFHDFSTDLTDFGKNSFLWQLKSNVIHLVSWYLIFLQVFCQNERVLVSYFCMVEWTRTIGGSILQTSSIHRLRLGKIQPFIVDHSSIKGRLNEMIVTVSSPIGRITRMLEIPQSHLQNEAFSARKYFFHLRGPLTFSNYLGDC